MEGKYLYMKMRGGVLALFIYAWKMEGLSSSGSVLR